MHFQVPQFIETEDRIVGPLTLKQFLLVGIPVGIVFLFYFTTRTSFTIMAALILIPIGIALAVVKINGQTLPAIIVHLAAFAWAPQTYVWQPENAALPKSKKTLQQFAGASAIERLITGFALKRARQSVETRGVALPAAQRPKAPRRRSHAERYLIFSRRTGERHAARRIDYH